MRAAMVVWVGGLREKARALRAAAGRRRRWFGALRLFTVPRLALLALAGCSGGGVHTAAGPPPGAEPSPEPAHVVAEFLDAANRRDHAAMASRFGTAAGPIGDRGGTLGCALRKVGSWIGLDDRCLTAEEVELRMDLIAAVLAHGSYRTGSQAAVAGRGRPATRVEVEVDVAADHGVTVPFVLIQADDGSWLVEEVGLERLVR